MLRGEMGWIRTNNETTVEPKENIPRVLTELFDTYGDSTIPTSVKKYFEQSHVKYVMLEVKDRKDMIQPACTPQIDENAYFIPLPKKKNSCVFTIVRGDFGYGSSMRLYHQLSRDLWWRVDSSSSRPDRKFSGVRR